MVALITPPKITIRLTDADRKLVEALSQKLSSTKYGLRVGCSELVRLAIRELAKKEKVKVAA